MDIEPLKTLLSYSSDKKDTLLNFLEKKVRSKVIKLEYEENQFYINDKIFCIKKNTLELEYIGKIYCIDDDDIIGLKLSNVRNINIDPEKYYIFVKVKTKDIKKRDFYKQLLEQL